MCGLGSLLLCLQVKIAWWPKLFSGPRATRKGTEPWQLLKFPPIHPFNWMACKSSFCVLKAPCIQGATPGCQVTSEYFKNDILFHHLSEWYTFSDLDTISSFSSEKVHTFKVKTIYNLMFKVVWKERLVRIYISPHCLTNITRKYFIQCVQTPYNHVIEQENFYYDLPYINQEKLYEPQVLLHTVQCVIYCLHILPSTLVCNNSEYLPIWRILSW